MLRALRNQTQSIFFKCFLVLLICGFALWGVGDLTGGSKGKSVLSVENKNIAVEEVLNEINRARYLMPERPSLEKAFENGMHKSILQKFEQEILINAEAKNLNLNVPLSEQMNSIRKEKAFKDPLGKFSQNKFLQSLNNAGLTESKYLEMIKTESNFKQISMPFILNDFYNESVIKKIIDWQNEIRDIEYEIFDIINKNEIKRPSNETLKSFYDKNKSLYEIPITRNINYIEINPNNFENQVIVNKKQIDEKYEIEKSNYIKEEEREILQITTQDKIKAKQFIDLIGKGENFYKVAKDKFNLLETDINLGFLKKSELPLESSDFIFKAKLNETIGPINTKFGLTIYKIINITPQKQIKYEEAIQDIKKKLIKELSIEILYEKLDVIEDLIAEGNSLNEISNSEVLNKKALVKSYENISKQGLIYSHDKEPIFLNKNVQFLNNIWNTEINELSEIFNTNDDTYFLIEVVQENDKQIPVFELALPKIYEQWINKQSILKTKEKVNNLISLKNNNLSLKASIKRGEKSLDKLNDPNLINSIFEINNKKVNLLISQNKLLAIKLIKSKIDNYVFNEKTYNDLNISFSKSFFNDFSDLYIQNLALKHKLKRNYQELESYFINPDKSN